MAIEKFRGQYGFLSNYYDAKVSMDGYDYNSVEHAFQAAKCKHREDRIEIRLADTPGKAKRLGNRVELRSDWEEVKVSVMASLVLQKFARHPHLRRRLLATGVEQIVEGNTWNDTFWGVCAGQGKNMLGRILMGVRRRLS